MLYFHRRFLDDPNGRPRYQALRHAAGDRLTQRLLDIPGPMGLLCAEKRVAECHRQRVAPLLADRQGAAVHHLE